MTGVLESLGGEASGIGEVVDRIVLVGVDGEVRWESWYEGLKRGGGEAGSMLWCHDG